MIDGCKTRTLAYLEKEAAKQGITMDRMISTNGIMWVLKIGGGSQTIKDNKKSEDSKVDICIDSPRLFHVADILSKVKVGQDLTSDSLSDLYMDISKDSSITLKAQFQLNQVLQSTAKKFKKGSFTRKDEDPLYSLKEWILEMMDTKFLRSCNQPHDDSYHKFFLGNVGCSTSWLGLTRKPINYHIEFSMEYVGTTYKESTPESQESTCTFSEKAESIITGVETFTVKVGANRPVYTDHLKYIFQSKWKWGENL